MFSRHDEQYMRMALSYARRGLGYTAPNPSVGCVLVKGDVVLAAAHTAPGGRPHAEVVALELAGVGAKGATAYVTLEPCSHQGQTGPCAQALIDAGVARVVVACTDPDPRVSGRGIEMLNSAGVQVEEGLLKDEAERLNAGFIKRVSQNKPFVTLKVATSKDNKIAAAPGQRTQISGDLANRYMHLLRSQHDAILVGIDTVLADDPMLTARVNGVEHNIMRVVLDTDLKLPLECKLVQSAKDDPAVVFYKEGDSSKIQALKDAGVTLVKHDPRDLNGVLEYLAEQGITRLLVEGGAKVHKSFLDVGCTDQFLWLRAPHIIGEGGVEAIHGLDITNIEAISGLKHQKTQVLGEDLLEIYG